MKGFFVLVLLVSSCTITRQTSNCLYCVNNWEFINKDFESFIYNELGNPDSTRSEKLNLLNQNVPRWDILYYGKSQIILEEGYLKEIEIVDGQLNFSGHKIGESLSCFERLYPFVKDSLDSNMYLHYIIEHDITMYFEIDSTQRVKRMGCFVR